MSRYQVRELACDPPGWHTEINQWAEEWPGIVVEYPTNRRSQMAPGVSAFFGAVVEQELTHDDDPRLARDIGHAVVKSTAEGNLITKDHPDSPRKIDLAVAAVIAHDRAAASVITPWVGWA
jgi:phage terminase large subunit-like protein